MKFQYRPLWLFVVSTVLVFDVDMALAIPKPDQPTDVHCPKNGTVYFSTGYNHLKLYKYRLTVYEKQDYSQDATVDADWTVGTLDRRSGKLLSELLLEWSCPVGRGNCQISPRLLSGNADYPPVDEVPLNPNFTIASDHAPYAIIIPGFVEWQWSYVDGLREYGDLKFFTKDEVVPDLSDQLTWVRASCANISSGR